MAMQVETGDRVSHCPPDPLARARGLVAVLEEALQAARCLLVTMESAGCCPSATAYPRLAPVSLNVASNRMCNTSPTADDVRATLATRTACSVRAAPDGLSRREAEVLGLLATGKSNHRIAQALFLSPRTVQRHVANAYLKIGAHNRAEATAYALSHGLA